MKSVAYSILPLLFLSACVSSSGDEPTQIIGSSPEEVSRIWIDLYNKENFEQLKIISSGQMLQLVTEAEEIFDGEFDEEFPMDEGEDPLPPVLVANMGCEEESPNKATCIYCCNEGKNETVNLIKEGEQWKVIEIIADLSEEEDFDDEDDLLIEDMLDNQPIDSLLGQ